MSGATVLGGGIAGETRKRCAGGRRGRISRERRQRGFTLLEILIATAILTIGLVSIVSLFPVAISLGREVIETSNAVVIAQSVAESIREGVRNRKRFVPGANGETNIYFVFEHDGVKDPIPLKQEHESPRHDYFILLPTYGRGRVSVGQSEAERRFNVIENAAKTFVYPETDEELPNGLGSAQRADNDADDDGDNKFWTFPIEKVYHLGQELTPGGRSPALKDIELEVLKQYSFAIAITPSFFDADNDPNLRSFDPAGQLFHVRIFIFRAFQHSEFTEDSKPVYEVDFEVSI